MSSENILLAARIFEKIASSKKEAPDWAPFGEFAWTKYREGVPEKPETELEKEIYSQIKKHFASTNRTGLPRITATLLSMLMKLGWYKDILHPPPNKKLYRGLKLNKQKLAELLDKPIKEIEDEGSFKINKSIPHDNGCSTSWTAKKQITKDFSENGKRGYAVTLIANVDDNQFKFIAGPGGLYDVEGLSRWHLEKETIGLEPITVSIIEWKCL